MSGADGPADERIIEGNDERIDIDWTSETASAVVNAVAAVLSRIHPDVRPGEFIKSVHIESEDADSHVEVIVPNYDAEVSPEEAERN